ncbi:unnamed protein product [Protopolystoma xenopodis]|uniref:Uncharacterized protein n=1 Tax=Protopolystoma xenopodis TaxID=117903 RepID=A0A448XL64_9PLAT|nr:unnamed protein product [Protopolystoma xenopodis]
MNIHHLTEPAPGAPIPNSWPDQNSLVPASTDPEIVVTGKDTNGCILLPPSTPSIPSQHTDKVSPLILSPLPLVLAPVATGKIFDPTESSRNYVVLTDPEEQDLNGSREFSDRADERVQKITSKMLNEIGGVSAETREEYDAGGDNDEEGDDENEGPEDEEDEEDSDDGYYDYYENCDSYGQPFLDGPNTHDLFPEADEDSFHTRYHRRPFFSWF